MPQSRGPHARLGALCLAVAGILFVLYPAIRPFSDETSLQGAEAFASNAWIVAHVLAMLQPLETGSWRAAGGAGRRAVVGGHGPDPALLRRRGLRSPRHRTRGGQAAQPC